MRTIAYKTSTLTFCYPIFQEDMADYFVDSMMLEPRPLQAGSIPEDAPYTSPLKVNLDIPIEKLVYAGNGESTDMIRKMLISYSALYLQVQTDKGNTYIIRVSNSFSAPDHWHDSVDNDEAESWEYRYDLSVRTTISQASMTVEGDQVFLEEEIPGPLQYHENMWYIELNLNISGVINYNDDTFKLEINGVHAIAADGAEIPFEGGTIVGFDMATFI